MSNQTLVDKTLEHFVLLGDRSIACDARVLEKVDLLRAAEGFDAELDRGTETFGPIRGQVR